MELIDGSINKLLENINAREKNLEDGILTYLIKTEAILEDWINLEFCNQIDKTIQKEGKGYSVYPAQKINNTKFDLIVYGGDEGIRYILEVKPMVNWFSPYEQIDNIIDDIDRLKELETPNGCEKIILVFAVFAIPKEETLEKNYLKWMKRRIAESPNRSIKENYHKKLTERLRMIRKLDLKNLSSKGFQNEVFQNLVLNVFYSKVD
ncbi:MAG: hypothetical protein AAF518_11875 [Spirochaetota bacterium]